MLRNLSELKKAVIYCLRLAWQSSKGYTLLRLAGNFLIPVFTIAASYITKLILDLLTAGGSGIERQILFLLLSALFVSLAINFLRRFTQYTQTIHNSSAARFLFAFVCPLERSRLYQCYFLTRQYIRHFGPAEHLVRAHYHCPGHPAGSCQPVLHPEDLL